MCIPCWSRVNVFFCSVSQAHLLSKFYPPPPSLCDKSAPSHINPATRLNFTDILNKQHNLNPAHPCNTKKYLIHKSNLPTAENRKIRDLFHVKCYVDISTDEENETVVWVFSTKKPRRWFNRNTFPYSIQCVSFFIHLVSLSLCNECNSQIWIRNIFRKKVYSCVAIFFILFLFFCLFIRFYEFVSPGHIS